jgi:ABC-2 type transport system ATP-binding protein
VHKFQFENGQVHFDVDTDRLGDVISKIASLGIRNLVSRPPTLEQLFMRHYGEELSEAELAIPDEDDSA